MTGAIHPGDMCAVMGPSGAGKTTLLDIVSRRKTEGKVLGQARFDGAVPSTSLVKKDTAYIQQQDCFFGGATVRETIMFAAMAKLPRLSRRDGVSGALVCCSDVEDTQEKRARVSKVISQLNLDRRAETYGQQTDPRRFRRRDEARRGGVRVAVLASVHVPGRAHQRAGQRDGV